MEDQQLESVLYFLMERIMRKAKSETKKVFQEISSPVSIDQWIILKKIAETQPITQREIASSTFKEPAAVTRILDILSKKELVTRLPVVGDRRKYHIQLTESGKKVVKNILPNIVDLRKRGVEGLSDIEVEQLQVLLTKMFNGMFLSK